MLYLGKELALLGRVMIYSAVVSSNIVLANPKGQKWLGLPMYSILVYFSVYYGTLQRYVMECWIFFETMIHFMLLRPNSSGNASICLVVYGPFYVFLWDYLGISQRYMRKMRVILYYTSVMVFLTFPLLTWQITLILLGISVSILPLYYFFEQPWRLNY
jgi:hypothetical protein